MNGRDAVKVAVVQRSPAFMNLNASLDRAVAAILEAGSNGAELISFSEAWLSGYPYWTEGWDTTAQQWIPARVIFHDNAIVIPSPETDRLCAAAKKANAHVVIGVEELDARNGVQTIYNTMLYIGRDGTILGRHRKLIPTFSEKMFWGVGNADDLFVVDTDIGRIGGLICGEHESPAILAAQLALGCDFHISFFPGSFSLTKGPRLEEPDSNGNFWGQSNVRAVALMAGAFVLSGVSILNPKDVDPTFPFAGKMNIDYAIGGSAIISPLAEPLIGPVYNLETILYAVCPSAMIKGVKSIADSNGHYSRPDAVRVQIRNPDGSWRTVPPTPTENFVASNDVTGAGTTP